MQDEPHESGAEDRKKSKKPEEGREPEAKSNVVSIIQQNALIVNGRFGRPQGRTGGWI